MTKLTTNEVTVESDIPRVVVTQLHDDAHRSFRSIATATNLDRQLIENLYHGTVAHVAVTAADALYALQGEVELANARLARRWQL